MVYAVTGSLASGKSTVVGMLKRRGAHVYDLDGIVHRYYANSRSFVYRRVAAMFPEAVKGSRISRQKLATIVFGDRERLRSLEKIVHPVVIKDLRDWVGRVRAKKGVFIAEVPLLFEKQLSRLFDGVVLVYVKRKVLLERILAKRGLSLKEAKKRLALYMPVRKKNKRVDFIVDNSATQRALARAVDQLWGQLK